MTTERAVPTVSGSRSAPSASPWIWTGAAAAAVCFNFSITMAANGGLFREYFLVLRSFAGDKVLHFLLVGGMTYLVARALAAWFPKRAVTVAATVVISTTCLAIIEESCQQFLSERSYDLWDMAANVAGILVLGAVAIVQVWRQRTGEQGLPPA